MKLKRKKEELIVGQSRTIVKFLYFPTKIDGEIRWLEYVSIRQIYVLSHIFTLGSLSVWKTHWKNIKFLD